ncbi:hypothetical protein DFH09DRAFT_1081731 [Mycena vulgaris]|nr:hypothetical protein DFH09DRAFT_1081731 [Mycena vulgaris]
MAGSTQKPKRAATTTSKAKKAAAIAATESKETEAPRKPPDAGGCTFLEQSSVPPPCAVLYFLQRLTGIDTDRAGCEAQGAERASGMSLKWPKILKCGSCKLPLRPERATVHQLGSDYEADARRPDAG